MEVEHTTVVGEKGVEAVPLCFEPLDGMPGEMLDPIWSELDGFGNGVLNGLLSSDLHDGGAGAEMKSNEQFAQHGVAGTPHAEMDPEAVSLGGVVNVHDYLSITAIPHSNTQAPYGLALPGSHENLGFHSSSFQVKDEMLIGELDGSSAVGNSNGHTECGVRRQEQFLLSSNTVEGREEVKLGFVGVDSIRDISERTVCIYEPSTHHEDVSDRTDIIVAHQEVETGARVNHVVQGNLVEQDGDLVADGPRTSEAQRVNRTEQGDSRLLNVSAEMSHAGTASFKEEVLGEELEMGSVGLHNANGSVECHTTQLSSDETEEALDGVEQEILVEQEDDPEESDIQGSEVDQEEIISVDKEIHVSADYPQPKIIPDFASEMLRDGSLSAEGLASKGFVFISDDESDSDEDSDDSPDEEEDGVSSVADSDEEGALGSKRKVKPAPKGKEEMKEADDAGPPRSKHELDVLPPVPKVTSTLEPHHKTMSVGQISSVLDLRVIVESSGSERVLNENSIIWLTESRVPLGIVDEVFGPVKNPFYVVRFNELAEIPEDAKTGADVSYVSEFSEFVFKENPSLYRKGVDASGLDDEELGSDEEIEFSDDEKEAAARMRQKSKRALDNREDRQGQDLKSANGQHSKGQRTERGRGRGRGGGRGAATANAVDSAADFVAGMDLQGSSPWRSTRPGGPQQNGRRWNRGRQQNSARNSGHQDSHMRGSRAGPPDGQRSSPQHQGSSNGRDGLYFAEQANRQMFAEQANRQMLAQQANRQMLAESANRQMLAQQANQGGGMQAVPFNAGAIPAHLQGQGVLRQKPTTGFQAHGYPQAPGYDARQGNAYSVPGGPQYIQNSAVFTNPPLPPNPFFNNQAQGQLNMIHNPGYGNIVHAGQVTFGLPVDHSLGNAQVGVHPSLRSNGEVAMDHRHPSMPKNSQNQGSQWHGPNKYYK